VPPCLPAHQTELSSASVAPAQNMRVPSLLTGAYAPPNRAAWAMWWARRTAASTLVGHFGAAGPGVGRQAVETVTENSYALRVRPVLRPVDALQRGGEAVECHAVSDRADAPEGPLPGHRSGPSHGMVLGVPYLISRLPPPPDGPKRRIPGTSTLFAVSGQRASGGICAHLHTLRLTYRYRSIG
jgi:hypothetical protein